MKVLVVGAGFTGATIARVLAEKGHNVHVIDERYHIGGNAYDYIDHGVNVHKYGPHIFHTNNREVVTFLSRFTDWLPYEHRVRAVIGNVNVPFPPNAETLKIVPREKLIDIFYRPYTEKMWGMPLEKVSPNVLARVPIREDNEDRYFPNDWFQSMPQDGYTALFKNMLKHSRITIDLQCPFDHYMTEKYDHVFYTGPIDRFHNFKYGLLPYRSIVFHFKVQRNTREQTVATFNFTDRGPFTRVTNMRLLPGPHQESDDTIVCAEEPVPCYDVREPYYPVPDVDGKNRELYKKYAEIPSGNVTFCGRLGKYVYINMDQAVSSALAVARKFLNE